MLFFAHTANPFPVMKQGFPCIVFSQGNPCNENRGPAMRTGVPCNENRFFLVWKTSQGNPDLALYWPCTGLQCIKMKRKSFNFINDLFLITVDILILWMVLNT